MEGAERFDDIKAGLVLEALSRGLTPGPIARSLGLTRATLYQWRAANPEFRIAWEHAVGVAADAVEQVIYFAALRGDPDAQKLWLRANRPMRFDRRNVINALLLQSRLPGSMPFDPTEVDDLRSSVVRDVASLAHNTDCLSVPQVVRSKHVMQGKAPPVWSETYAGPWPRCTIEFADYEGEAIEVIADGVRVPPAQMSDLVALLDAQEDAYSRYNASLREAAERTGGSYRYARTADACDAADERTGEPASEPYLLEATSEADAGMHGGDLPHER